MTRKPEARALCLLVARHYGLSDEATQTALIAAEREPARTGSVYAAILASLVVERRMYGEASAVAAREAVNL